MKHIDVAEVLRDKSPRLAGLVPRPAVNWLRRVIHEEQINHILVNYSHLDTFAFIRASLDYMGIGYTSAGMERLDPAGRYIFASNHPFGGLDGLMLASEVERRFGDARVVVNDLLMHIDPLRPIFIPVNKHGRQNGGSVQAFNAAFESDLPVITFPAGLCSRRIRGCVQDTEWKTNFIKRARATGRSIVPVYFDGCLSAFFYNLSNLRKRLGVKVNIEMLWLVDEMFRQQGSTFEIRIGEPVAPEALAALSPRQAADEIRRLSYEMKKKTF